MRKVIVSALLALVAACATPYVEGGLMGGVNAVPMGGDVYRVQAQLNAYSDQSMVQDYLLLKAADTAVAQGAVGFVIIDSQNTSRTATIVTPGTATTTANAQAFGNSAYGTATTTYTPAQAHTMIRPGGIMLISLVREAPANGAYFNAAQIQQAIGARVRR